ncbi:MAG: ferritin-like domain-containing protein [Myxococcales bacterium]|nr:ferritin-like domain-containing protein [Myxococcales bacterium]
MLDAITTAELGRRWAYRASVEWGATHRFARLADRMAAAGCAPALVATAREATRQEHAHVELCAGLAARFGAAWRADEDPAPEVAPPGWSPHARVLYEVVAFCCVTETSNTALVADGLPAIDDRAIERAARRILADEVQHSRLGWQFLATHPLDAAQAALIAAHLPAMLRGAVRVDLFRPHAIVGDEAAMARHGSSPIAQRRAAFLAAMREVLLPGLAAAGVDGAAGAAFLDELAAHAA